jgi:hypothetical protein
MQSAVLRISSHQYSGLPATVQADPSITVQFRRPWYYLTFPTEQARTLFALQYSEYCKPMNTPTYTIREDECND